MSKTVTTSIALAGINPAPPRPTGDPGELRTGATALGKIGTDITDASTKAKNIGGSLTDSWQGAAATKFQSVGTAYVGDAAKVTSNITEAQAALVKAATGIENAQKDYDAAMIEYKQYVAEDNTDATQSAQDASTASQLAASKDKKVGKVNTSTYVQEAESNAQSAAGLANAAAAAANAAVKKMVVANADAVLAKMSAIGALTTARLTVAAADMSKDSNIGTITDKGTVLDPVADTVGAPVVINVSKGDTLATVSQALYGDTSHTSQAATALGLTAGQSLTAGKYRVPLSASGMIPGGLAAAFTGALTAAQITSLGKNAGSLSLAPALEKTKKELSTAGTGHAGLTMTVSSKPVNAGRGYIEKAGHQGYMADHGVQEGVMDGIRNGAGDVHSIMHGHVWAAGGIVWSGAGIITNSATNFVWHGVAAVGDLVGGWL